VLEVGSGAVSSSAAQLIGTLAHHRHMGVLPTPGGYRATAAAGGRPASSGL